MLVMYCVSVLVFAYYSASSEMISIQSVVRHFDKQFMPAMSVYTNTTARSQLSCVQLCRPTELCTAVFYEKGTGSGWCTLVKSSLIFPEGIVFQKTQNSVSFVDMGRGDWALNQSCTFNEDCWALLSNNSECINGSCECYPCFKRTSAGCVAANCSRFSDDFLEYRQCNFGFDDETKVVRSFDECRGYCLNETSYFCRSFNHVYPVNICNLRKENICTSYYPVDKKYKILRRSCDPVTKNYYHRRCIAYE